MNRKSRQRRAAMEFERHVREVKRGLAEASKAEKAASEAKDSGAQPATDDDTVSKAAPAERDEIEEEPT